VNGDVPVTADYDGDGRKTVFIFAPETGEVQLSPPVLS
jgi:hypothetical protein